MLRFTVSELTRRIAGLLTATFDDVEVEGEVSGYKVHSSGHWYFSLKDGDAVVACVMFRNDNQRMRRQPREGERLIARGGVDVYPPRGTYSFVVRQLTAAGKGELQRKLDELRARLHAEGLFDPRRKRRLPEVPRAIGIATSPTGAAFADIVRVVRQRYPTMTIFLAPCRVQGEGAAAEIARAVQLLNEHGKSDVLIVGRGGGSAEDLWAFNEEIVVRAVVESRIPVVSAVGHEIDTALSDFAADVRAATPSHAAEMCTPVRAELAAAVAGLEQRLRLAMNRRLSHLRDRVSRVRLLHPRQRLERGRLRLDELEERLREASLRYLLARRARLTSASRHLDLLTPALVVQRSRLRTTNLERRLRDAGARILPQRRDRLGAAARHLEALSPLAVLVRGYAIAAKDGVALTDAAALTPGDTIEVRLAKGAIEATVTTVKGDGRG